jgi:hypothetical protein
MLIYSIENRESLSYPFCLFCEDLVSMAKNVMARRQIANMISLALIPASLVRQRFAIIKNDLHSYNPAFSPFLNYFRRTYIDSRKFPIESWNHFEHLGTRPRTNNHLEGTHRQLKV